MLTCILLLISYRLRKRVAVFWCVFACLLALSILINGRNLIQYLNFLVRLILPILIITTIEACVDAGVLRRNLSYELFLKWRYLFPACIIIPYILGTGFHTYENSIGYKGFYHAQNDIGYVLIILYLFSLYGLSKRIDLKNMLAVIILLICNLILGLKSNYILVVAISVIYFIKKEKLGQGAKKVFVMVGVMMGILSLAVLYWNEISSIVKRWQYFYVQRDFLSFLTSSRSERILPAYEWIKGRWGMVGIFFGSGVGYQLHTGLIEMDLFDVFFQIGLCGVVLIYGFYFRLLKRYHAMGFYRWGIWLSILYSTIVGHVLESALSGMFFSVLCCGPIYEYCQINEKANPPAMLGRIE